MKSTAQGKTLPLISKRSKSLTYINILINQRKEEKASLPLPVDSVPMTWASGGANVPAAGDKSLGGVPPLETLPV